MRRHGAAERVRHVSNADHKLDDLLDRWTVPPMPRVLLANILARARAEDAALDRLLDAADAVPPLVRDLAPAIAARARRARLVRRVAMWLGPMAAVAAVLLVALMLHFGQQTRTPGGPTDLTKTTTPDVSVVAAVAPADEPIVANLDLLQDLPVLVHWDTIQAMEALEAQHATGAGPL